MAGSGQQLGYQELGEASSFYGQRANDIGDMMNSIQSQNDLLLAGWKSETATQFSETYENHYKKALESLQQALESVSKAIANYSQNAQDFDTQQKAGMQIQG